MLEVGDVSNFPLCDGSHVNIRTVMLGHNHDLTLAAQETLAKLVRVRSKI
ncbi:hypothetical protein ARALYDRAFT_916879 [Arabidopsis lyrata subsp. lyrata]|uniref:Uncharacterized protein n=1 Tax=Arabidopsis lyrata subsp. lyrata TaxID=81972 RepID=D7MTB6_ARALL|nr:hypothetical protein ARALYDRAFT_916879 [Arabidopsis lyrata subsp. lyrata]